MCSLESFQIGCWSWACSVNCHNRWVIKTLLNWHSPSVQSVYCKQFGGCPIVSSEHNGMYSLSVWYALFNHFPQTITGHLRLRTHPLSLLLSVWLHTRAHTRTNARTHTPDEVLAQIPELPIRCLTARGRDTAQKYRVCAAAQNTGPIAHFQRLRQIESNISAFIRVLIYSQFWFETGVTNLIFNNWISKIHEGRTGIGVNARFTSLSVLSVHSDGTKCIVESNGMFLYERHSLLCSVKWSMTEWDKGRRCARG